MAFSLEVFHPEFCVLFLFSHAFHNTAFTDKLVADLLSLVNCWHWIWCFVPCFFLLVGEGTYQGLHTEIVTKDYSATAAYWLVAITA